jgi:hypothetical protein
MRKIRGDKSRGIIVHTYMETSQGNSLGIYLYLKLKCHFFILPFLFLPLQNQRTDLPGGRSGVSWKGEVLGKDIEG